jgi:hypothetical protein
MRKFKWQPNKTTRLNFSELRKTYLVPGHFKRYDHHEIPNDHERGWVNSKLHERSAERLRKVKPIVTSDLLRAYHQQGILALSQTLDYPPWNLFVILTKRQKKTKYTKYDHIQQKEAMLNDIQSPLMQKVSKKRADRFEAKMIKFFKKQGVKLKDEKDLVKEQIAQYGRPMWTVDLWFADNPIIINGTKIYWIECKNYMLTDNRLFLPSVRKQVRKYRDQWGPGAIAFSKGFTCELNEKDVMVLDAFDFEKKIEKT